eukprot:6213343-Pleurochrysis_carterae.AAC.9
MARPHTHAQVLLLALVGRGLVLGRLASRARVGALALALRAQHARQQRRRVAALLRHRPLLFLLSLVNLALVQLVLVEVALLLAQRRLDYALARRGLLLRLARPANVVRARAVAKYVVHVPRRAAPSHARRRRWRRRLASNGAAAAVRRVVGCRARLFVRRPARRCVCAALLGGGGRCTLLLELERAHHEQRRRQGLLLRLARAIGAATVQVRHRLCQSVHDGRLPQRTENGQR